MRRRRASAVGVDQQCQLSSTGKLPASTLLRDRIEAIARYDWWQVLYYENQWSRMVNSYKAELNFLSITFSLIAAMTYPVVFLSFEEIKSTTLRKVLFVCVTIGFISSFGALIFVVHGFIAVNLCTTAKDVDVYFNKSIFLFSQELSLMKLVELMTRISLNCCSLSCCIYAFGAHSVEVAIVVTGFCVLLSILVLGVSFTWEHEFNAKLEAKRQYHLDVTKSSKEHIEYVECLFKILSDIQAEGYFGTIYMHCPKPNDLPELLRLRNLELCQLLDSPLHLTIKIKHALECDELIEMMDLPSGDVFPNSPTGPNNRTYLQSPVPQTVGHITHIPSLPHMEVQHMPSGMSAMSGMTSASNMTRLMSLGSMKNMKSFKFDENSKNMGISAESNKIDMYSNSEPVIRGQGGALESF